MKKSPFCGNRRSPCLDCKKREIGCHDVCGDYKKYSSLRKAEREDIKRIYPPTAKKCGKHFGNEEYRRAK